MQDINEFKDIILCGGAYLGIEFGSTRIKAVLTDKSGVLLASGSHSWENQLKDGIWTYDNDAILSGLRKCYESLCDDVNEKYGIELTSLASMGISAMMHGYLAFDKDGKLLVPFRTWRNTITGEACDELSELFAFNIPQRWSIAHLYQAILNGEEHVKDIAFITTLAGYIHYLLTGEKVLGIGDASGMFPIDSATLDYDESMLKKFDTLTEKYAFPWKLKDILPKVLPAGERAGVLNEDGIALLGEKCALTHSIPLCPPEGDAGTGMVATNSVLQRTGNVSAGTSIFAMAVLERPLSAMHREIDMVTTPSGDIVAMVHCNNCSSDIDAWVNLIKQALGAFNVSPSADELYSTLFNAALEGDPDCSGLLSYNFFSGEHTVSLEEGRPLFVRMPKSNLSLSNFMRTHIYSAFATLKQGMDILFKEENVTLDRMNGHGGLFKVEGVGASILANALSTPIATLSTAGEGGPWGMALLASYMINKAENETLSSFLSDKIFVSGSEKVYAPDSDGVEGFEKYMLSFKTALEVEAKAIEKLR